MKKLDATFIALIVLFSFIESCVKAISLDVSDVMKIIFISILLFGGIKATLLTYDAIMFYENNKDGEDK